MNLPTKNDSYVFPENADQRLVTLTGALRALGDLFSFYEGDMNLVDKEGLGSLVEILASECETARLQVLDERKTPNEYRAGPTTGH